MQLELISVLQESFKKTDVEQLCLIVEHIRSHGLLYADYDSRQSILVETLLEISIALVKEPNFAVSNQSWLFVHITYDIIFHQVRLEEYPSSCANLYFYLSKDVLDEAHQHLLKTNWHYEMSVYIHPNGLPMVFQNKRRVFGSLQPYETFDRQ